MEVLVIIEVVLFSVNLITTATFNGTVLATFDCIYIILFSRYIYLYGVYLDSKKINVKNIGNFDEYREKVSEVVSDLGKKSEAIVEDMTSKDDEKSNDSEKSSDTTHKNKDDDKTKKNNKKDKNGEDK